MHRGPRPAARIGAERLAVLGDQLDHRLEPVLLHEGEMLGEALVARQPVFRAADRPVQHQAQRASPDGSRRTPPRRSTPMQPPMMCARSILR